MTIPMLEYVDRLKGVLESDGQYMEQARWLMGAVLFQVGDRPYTLYFHKGRIIEAEAGAAPTGTDFALAGAEDAWTRLVSGELTLARALSSGLRLEGDQLKAGGNLHALSLLFQFMAANLAAEKAK